MTPESSILVAQQPFGSRRRVAALKIDQQIGVDQVGHGPPGAPTLPRAA